MPFPTYQIKVYDPATADLRTVLFLTNTYRLKYSRVLNDVGVFALSLPDDRDYSAIFTDDAFVDIMRADANGTMRLESTYLVQSIERFEAERGERTVVGGLHLNCLLARRVVDPSDDSVQPNGGYATKAGSAGNVIRAYVREQASDLASTDRQFPRLSVPVPTAFGSGVGANLRFEMLLEELQKLARTGGIDFEIQHVNGTGDLECTIGAIGTDKSVETNLFPPYTVFNPMRGNLAEPKLLVDRTKEATFVYSMGDGEGANRTIIEVSTGAVSDTPYNRKEKTIDGRVNQKKADAFQLHLSALKYLAENKPKVEFNFELLLTSGGGVYRTDWEFGDIVTVAWRDVVRTLRITEMEFNVGPEGEDIAVKLTNETL